MTDDTAALALNKVTIAPYEDGYRLRWPALDLELYYTHPHRSGTAIKMTVRPTRAGADLLAPKTISLKSGEALASLAKQLQRVAPLDDGRWLMMLEQAALAILQRLEASDPAICLDLADATLPPHEPFIINEILYAQHPTIIYGPPGSLKTILAYLIALRLGAPGRTAGVGSAVAARVLLVDYELTRESTIRLLQQLTRGQPDLPTTHLAYWHPRKALRHCVGDLQRQLRDTGTHVLVIDSLSRAAGGNLVDPDDATAFYDALAAAAPGLPALILAHTAKHAEDTQRTIFGSMLFHALARRVFELQRLEPDGLVMRARKHGFGHAPDFAWRVWFRQAADGLPMIQFDPTDPALVLGTPEERVSTLIRRAGASGLPTSAIAAELSELPPRSVRRLLHDLAERGLVAVEAGHGRGHESVWRWREGC